MTSTESAPPSASFRIHADAFLATGDQFRLGCLDTESCHPLTSNLQRLSIDDLPHAIELMRKVDLDALVKMKTSLEAIQELSTAVTTVIAKGNRIFIFGCGATGRLAIAVENMCKRGMVDFGDRVTGFMSGGDCAMVKSIESFEDHQDWGARQLEDIGFSDGDLLIASSEGGETSIVIGCVLAASTLSKVMPYFLYCNPTDLLLKKIERSAAVIRCESVKKICLAVGPMALSGSTRLQASTVLMLAIATALVGIDIDSTISDLVNFYCSIDLSFLPKYIVAEEEAYGADETVVYRSAGIHAVTVMTDLTERCPTFSLRPFERYPSPGLAWQEMCLAYLAVKGTTNAAEAWETLLLRPPQCLDWSFCRHLTSTETLHHFDISESVIQKRSRMCKQHIFDLLPEGDGLKLSFRGSNDIISLCTKSDSESTKLLFQSVILKMILNIHSTLLMGRLERFKSNVMTFVAPTNLKLTDRAARYIQQILCVEHGMSADYESVIRRMEVLQDSTENDPMVNAVVKSFVTEHNLKSS